MATQLHATVKFCLIRSVTSIGQIRLALLKLEYGKRSSLRTTYGTSNTPNRPLLATALAVIPMRRQPKSAQSFLARLQPVSR